MAGSPVKHERAQRMAVLTSPENEEQTVAALCERLSGGLVDGLVVAEPMTLYEICEKEGWPYGRILAWIGASEARSKAVAEAYEFRARHYADETVGIADGVQGSESSEEIAAARLRIDTRFRYAKHNAPRIYGDAVRVEKTVSVTADAGLIGVARALVGKIKGRVIDAEKTVAGLNGPDGN